MPAPGDGGGNSFGKINGGGENNGGGSHGTSPERGGSRVSTGGGAAGVRGLMSRSQEPDQ